MIPQPDPSATPETDFSELLGAPLASALSAKGYTTLTPIQKSVLDPALDGRDLRMSSQTGSGKTLAVGFVLRHAFAEPMPRGGQASQPRALVIAPTRELAKQVEAELGWLYAPLKIRVVALTGGASYRDEHRALAQNPGIVVGTPGRLLDHLNRGSLNGSLVETVVLDEADRMLDLGFKEELESILATLPEGHRTHLVSATFDRQVAALADRVQSNATTVQGTPLGVANDDIDHVVYLAHPQQRIDALINLLLMQPDAQTLIFARTRAEVSEITEELRNQGFNADSLSGEMPQDARNRALAGMRRGATRVLVATDVAARGIDVPAIAFVIQLDTPNDPDTYTHRSGRTGRAGRKGTSALLIPPAALNRTKSLLARARVRHRIEPVPTAEAIRAADDQRALAELSRELDAEVPERIREQVRKLIEAGAAERALTHLLLESQNASVEPRQIQPLLPQQERKRPFQSAPRQRELAPQRGFAPRDRDFAPRDRDFAPRDRDFTPRNRDVAPSDRVDWVPFHVSWGEEHGADARRLVAMLCRRGGIRSSDIGAIRVSRKFSSVEVAARVSEGFRHATRTPDRRDPNVSIIPA